jgi:hypothetical protein
LTNNHNVVPVLPALTAFFSPFKARPCYIVFQGWAVLCEQSLLLFCHFWLAFQSGPATLVNRILSQTVLTGKITSK